MTTEPDASGNGNDGTYSDSSPSFVAGLVPGDTAWDVNLTYITVPDLTVSWLNTWSLELWLLIPSAFVGNDSQLFITGDLGGPSFAIVDIHLQGTIVTVTSQISGAGNWQTGVNAVPDDNAAHHVVVTFDGALGVLLYVDGNLVSWASTGSFVGTDPPTYATISETGSVQATFDEFATYDHVLSAGRVSAHYAARTSFGAYAAAVLADSPQVYYHFSSATGWILGQIPITP